MSNDLKSKFEQGLSSAPESNFKLTKVSQNSSYVYTLQETKKFWTQIQTIESEFEATSLCYRCHQSLRLKS